MMTDAAKAMLEKIEALLRERARVESELEAHYLLLGKALGVQTQEQKKTPSDSEPKRQSAGSVTETVLEILRMPPFKFSTAEIAQRVQHRIGPTGPTSVYVALNRLRERRMVRRAPTGEWHRVFYPNVQLAKQEAEQGSPDNYSKEEQQGH